MTLLGRAVGDLEADVFFTDTELAALRVYSRAYRLMKRTDVSSAIALMAMMGGYMNRKSDSPPGPTVLWRGYGRLQSRVAGQEEFSMFYDLVERPPP